MALMNMKDQEAALLDAYLNVDKGQETAEALMTKASSSQENFITRFYDSLLSKSGDISKQELPPVSTQPAVQVDPAEIEEFMQIYNNGVMQQTYDNDMGGLGSDAPDPLGNMGVPPARLVPVDDLGLDNPEPLFKLFDDIKNENIKKEELPDILGSLLGAGLRRRDSNFVGGEYETVGLGSFLFGGDEEDVSPKAEAGDQLALAKEEPKAATTSAKPTEGMGFLTFISKGEGGYESSNRGTKNNKIQGSTHSTTRDNKKLSEMTIDEIRAKMKIKSPDDADRLFAVGKYQLIPTTFEMAVKATGLSGDTVFNPETQEKLGQYLLFEKRPALGAYIKGESNDMNSALLEAAKEWASLPVPSGSKKGKSYYGKGNKAQHTLEQTIKALTTARTAYMNSVGAGPTEGLMVRPKLRPE